MSIISSIFDVSVLVKDAYTILQDTYGWPSWLIYIFFTVVIIFVGLVLGFGVLMIIDYCVTGTVKDDINNLADDSKDVEDLDDNDSQKILKPKTAPSSVPKLIASSTPQRKIKSNISSSVTQTQDDEALLDEILGDDNDDSEGLNTSDMAQATDEDEQTPNVVIRQRRVNK
ncbi:unnamed protein product [Rotaria magnacalcarata]|nr:unnamed protein product [Rotaria magnacalcarata]